MIPARNNKWHMVATIPKELRQFYNNRRHIQKSCGNADELEAKAMMRGAEGKAFRDEITPIWVAYYPSTQNQFF